MSRVLGIDLGTQSLKALVYDAQDRTVLASAAVPLDVRREADGSAEQQAEWWATALEGALAQLPAGLRASLEAVGVSGQQHGFVALDAAGAVLAPVKLWCDTSTQAEAEEITAAAGGMARVIELGGNPILVGYTASKIRWLARHHPQRYAALHSVLLPHDYLNYLLTARIGMEHGDASGTGLLDVRARRWSAPLLSALDPERDLSGCLPPLVEPGTVFGVITEVAARRFGLPEGIPVAPGGGDNMQAAIGTGNVRPGRLTMSLGTSGTLFAYSDRPIVDPQGQIAAFCDSTGGWLPLLCTMNCTYATELMKRALQVPAGEFESLLAAAPAGADGLQVLPFFGGERTPDLPDASASILGLNERNFTRAHLLRATVEGVSFGLRFGLDGLRRLGIEASEIVLTGGGARSAQWAQIIADVCALPVVRPAQDEGAAFGAALQALWVLERSRQPGLAIADLVDAHATRLPDSLRQPEPAAVARYAQAYANYLTSVTRLTDRRQAKDTGP